MRAVNDTKKQLYNNNPLFIFNNIYKQRLNSTLYNPLLLKKIGLFNEIIDNTLVNKYILNNYNWETSYECWQICQFYEEPCISLYDFIKADLYKNYVSFLNILVTTPPSDIKIVLENIRDICEN